VWSIIICNLVFIAFFYGWHWPAKHVTHGEVGAWFVYGAPIGIGLMTCGLFSRLQLYATLDGAIQ
jgi:hypothetical protein